MELTLYCNKCLHPIHHSIVTHKHKPAEVQHLWCWSRFWWNPCRRRIEEEARISEILELEDEYKFADYD